jgi:hypothetical protein
MNPMQSLRLLIAAAALGLAGFADPGKHFTIDFPQGWSTPATDAGGNAQSDAPSPSSVFCRANSVTLASLKDSTQPALNAEYSKPLDKPTWAGVFSVDAAKVEISEGEARLVDGHIVQVVTMTLAADILGVPMKARFVSHILPGHMVNAGCFAPSESFDAMRPTFEKVIMSLKPL